MSNISQNFLSDVKIRSLGLSTVGIWAIEGQQIFNLDSVRLLTEALGVPGILDL